MREAQKLAADIVLMVKGRDISNDESNLALMSVLLASLKYDGVTKEEMFNKVGEFWDCMPPLREHLDG